MEARKEKPAKKAGGRYSVPALERGMKILEWLAEHNEGETAADVASALKLPAPSVFRMLLTLADGGYLLRDEASSKYRLSRKMMSLGYKALEAKSLLEASLDSLKALRDESGESSFIAVLAGSKGVVLEHLPGLHAVVALIQVGHLFSLHTAAPGKALLAFLSKSERDALLDKMSFERYTNATITSREAFEAELEKVRERGVAYDLGEEMEELRCVGAPVFDRLGRPVAAVWISAPSSRIAGKELEKLSGVVVKHANCITKRLSI